jgi:hypothetical protein
MWYLFGTETESTGRPYTNEPGHATQAVEMADAIPFLRLDEIRRSRL